MHYIEIIQSYVCCIDLDDEFSSAEGATPMPRSFATPPIVELLCHPLNILALSYTLSTLHTVAKSRGSFDARLACLRAVSCLSEWAVAVDAMSKSDIFTELLRICADDADAAQSTASAPVFRQSSGHVPANTSPVPGSSIAGSAIPIPTRALAADEESEVIITACYSLANICQASTEYSELLFQKDLLSIMLELTTCGNLEAERQAMRCICSMCQIIASSSYDNAVLDKVGTSYYCVYY